MARLMSVDVEGLCCAVDFFYFNFSVEIRLSSRPFLCYNRFVAERTGPGVANRKKSKTLGNETPNPLI